jgi:hypothetical protein
MFVFGALSSYFVTYLFDFFKTDANGRYVEETMFMASLDAKKVLPIGWENV